MWQTTADGLAANHVPEEVTTQGHGVEPRPELIESYCIFELLDKRYVVGYAKVRNFGHFGSVSASELASDLAVADAGHKLALYRRRRFVPMSPEQLTAIRRKTKGWSRQGSPCSDFPFRLRGEGLR
jgi:hypothetical protein